jgi:DNA-binding transcriptional MerR regulator
MAGGAEEMSEAQEIRELINYLERRTASAEEVQAAELIEKLQAENAALRQRIAELEKDVVPECYRRLLDHAHGLSFGVDWNKGTHAEHHRNKLLKAVADCILLSASAQAKE